MQALHKPKEVMDMSPVAILPCTGAETVFIHLKQDHSEPLQHPKLFQ